MENFDTVNNENSKVSTFHWHAFDDAYYTWQDIIMQKKVVHYDDGWIN